MGLESWVFPAEVPGFLSAHEARCLAEMAAGRSVLEIGSYCGRSTISMGQTADSVVSVDWHRPAFAFPKGGTLERLQAGLHSFRVSERVVVLVGPAQDVLPWLASGQFGMIFHDAGHSEAEVVADISASRRLIRPGGLWAIHDYLHPEYGAGVRAAVASLFPGLDVRQEGSLAIVKEPPTGG